MVLNFCASFAVDGILCSLSTFHQSSHVLHCVHVPHNCLNLLISELLLPCLPFAAISTVACISSLVSPNITLHSIATLAKTILSKD